MQNNNNNNDYDYPKTFANFSRRDKRALLFNLLYTADSYEYDVSIDTIVDNYNRGFDLDIPLDSDLVKTVRKVINHREELDDSYKPLLSNWRFDRIGVCTKLILRYAIWELKNEVIDPTIVINEAIELAKCYAEKDAFKFINGVLDQVVKKYLESSEDQAQDS